MNSSRRAMVFGMGGLLGLAGAASGQGAFPPPPPVPVGPRQVDPDSLTRQLAERLRDLSEDAAAEVAQTPAGQHAPADLEELAESVDEFRAELRENRDAYRVRLAFGPIDGGWQRIKSQISPPGVAPETALARSAVRVDRLMGQVREAVGSNEPPPAYYGAANGRAPTGLDETRRMANALAARADALEAAVRAEMIAGPDGNRLAREAADLSRAADTFHDTLADPNAPPELLRDRFRPVAELSDRFNNDFRNVAAPPERVRMAWSSYQPTATMIQQQITFDPVPIGADPLPPAAIRTVAPLDPIGGAPAPAPPPVVLEPLPRTEYRVAFKPVAVPEVAGLANELVTQAEAFVQVFGPTARKVPEGAAFLADAERLRGAAIAFRQDAAQGLDLGNLAQRFGEVDASWQRLQRRTSRIAKGRVGPNIQQVGLMGQTCSQIRDALAIPGYAPY